MSTCDFKAGEWVRCVSPDPFGHYLRDKTYRVWRDTIPNGAYVSVVGEDRQSRSMYKSRFVCVQKKEFTDEKYEELLI